MIKKLKIKNENEVESTVNKYISEGYKVLNIFPYPDDNKQTIIVILEKKDNVIIG